MERSHPPPARPSQAEVAFALDTPGGKRPKAKKTFFSIRVSTTGWLPGASQIATTIVICTRPAQCHGGFPETLPFGGLIQDREAMSVSTMGSWLVEEA